ncbi:MAG: hypothetical protein LBE71_00120 [Dysgonamonadaceae bacterium]|nr:hypothetical protein [Dysgonamonadaceae bacterium]
MHSKFFVNSIICGKSFFFFNSNEVLRDGAIAIPGLLRLRLWVTTAALLPHPVIARAKSEAIQEEKKWIAAPLRGSG